MATTSDIKNGICIEFNNDLYIVTEFLHVKPGKGPAFVRTKLKNVRSGKNIDHTFSAGHKITITQIERRSYQYLYKDDMGLHFMNNETFEQIPIQEHMVDNPGLLKEGDSVELLVHVDTEEVLLCDLKDFVELEVTYTEPGLKGDTATNASKPATLETGAEIQVPLFVNNGDLIKIDTRKNAYVERVKK
ncbi:MAG: elongation factor P [Bernardetiaceae bacterium]|nr:elongation factor P [Bernardetiaceae bacterium]